MTFLSYVSNLTLFLGAFSYPYTGLLFSNTDSSRYGITPKMFQINTASAPVRSGVITVVSMTDYCLMGCEIVEFSRLLPIFWKTLAASVFT
jgi:hypothetical protein